MMAEVLPGLVLLAGAATLGLMTAAFAAGYRIGRRRWWRDLELRESLARRPKE